MSDPTADPQPRPAWASTDGHIEIAGPHRCLGAEQSTRGALHRVLALETVHRFAFSFGERDRAVLEDCFTEDASFAANIGGTQPVGPYVGRDAIVEWLTSYWPRQTDQRRHLVTDAVVDDLTADSATVTAMLTLAGSADGAMRLITAGFYRCVMRREGDGAWRIARFGAGYDAPY
jgi:ketosteroid isomerase-like protein